ncbi:DinB family protein [Arenibacter sp. ARW7G5Y1]|uniref:DinB family protein n=1 Tax=Arenibacter sp. ARW7G5Y1 TaxID=2135619 RepID=UPI000D758E9A|nr:DinB family protein [Arenibacter sp. ARW7G5Y1]PXX24936.1 DinB family protein [Arenibacter sp. ARW7G5Y1]|tara:strand:- start:427 stop:1032 length:606 start_codon:yes stop_codon:yes gene_type:complete
MKKVVLPIVLLAVLAFGVINSTLTDAEREFAVKEMTKSRDHFLNTIEGLNEAQLNYKATDDSWSIAECAEHIAISENMIFGMLQSTLAHGAEPGKRSEVKISDEGLIAMIEDRSKKVKTGEAFEPSGKYGSFEETVEEFKSKRKEHIEFVNSTQDDLRNRYQQLPFGTIDAYQILLFMSGHTERHIKQMEEVMDDEDFPME